MDNGYNQDEIEEILRRYTGSSASSDSSQPAKKDEPVKDEPVKDEPVKDEPVKDEPVKVEKPAEKKVEESAEKQDSKLSVKGGNRTGSGVVSNAPGSILAKSSSVKVSRVELMKRQVEENSVAPEKKKTSTNSKKINSNKTNSKKTKTKKVKTKKDTILNILLVVFIVTFLVSGGYLGMYYYNIHKAQESFDSLKDMIKDDAPGADTLSKTNGTDTDASELKFVDINGVRVQEKFADLYTSNNDFIGWLTIPGTEIDYPVMHTPSDEEFYLHKDFNKEKSSSGTLFLAAKSDALAPSDNVVIYGHNMKAGTMFHDLLKYETQDYYNEHKTFRFDTIGGNYEYEVIAAFRTEIKGEDNTFKYYEFINAGNKEEFDEFVEKVKSKTPYTIDTTAEYGDKLVTLSTCAYHASEGRYVVVAKRKTVE